MPIPNWLMRVFDANDAANDASYNGLAFVLLFANDE